VWNGHNDGDEDVAGAPRRPGEEARSLAQTADTLLRWFEATVPGSAPEIGLLSRPVGAGGSNETILFEVVADLSDGRGRAMHNLVLRIEPGDYRLFREVNFSRQFALLGLLQGQGVKVPAPLYFEADESWLGRAFFIMTRAEGKVPVSSPPYNRTGFLADASPTQRNLAWRAAVEELGRIHTLDVGAFSYLWTTRPSDGPAADFAEQVTSFHWAKGGKHAPFLEDVLQWLKAHRPKAISPGLSWGDARIGNMVFGHNFGLSAVIDWEQASLGGPMRDLGWWLFFDDLYSEEIGLERLEGMGSRADTIALWESVSGHAARDLLWFEIFAGFQLGVLMTRRCELREVSPPASNRNNNIFTRKVAKMLGVPQPADLAD